MATPTILSSDVKSRNTSTSCYVTLGTKVYDVTDFLSDHPGGGELILEYGGKDVTEIMQDEVSHLHSEAAYEILQDCFIGYVVGEEVLDVATKSSHPDEIIPLPASANGNGELNANGISNGKPVVFAATGLSSAEDLNKETDIAADYNKNKFLDLSKPLLMQVLFGGFSKDFYLEQVHRPRHYKGGASAPLFGNFLEPLSLTPWWMVPTAWLPPVAYGTYLASTQLSVLPLVLYWCLGTAIWTIVEYGLHRCLFHIDDYLPDHPLALTLHFLLHGIHHYLPMDKYRLVMPPAMFVILAAPFWKLAHTIFFYNWYAAVAVYCGGIFGYICYDLTHYFLHHRKLPSFYQSLKKYHLQHHFADYQNGFGVTSRFWDQVFGTELAIPPPKVIKAS